MRVPSPLRNCLCNVCDDESNGTCQTKATCLVMVKHGHTVTRCLRSDSLFERSLCNSMLPQMVSLCCSTDFCNTPALLPLELVNGREIHQPHSLQPQELALFFGLLGFAVLLIGAAPALVKRRVKMKPQRDWTASTERLAELSSSGSGACFGQPQLVENSIYRQIGALRPLGTGRFGRIYTAMYNCHEVLVKTFLSKDEEKFKQELEMYSTPLLCHENILGFIASDITHQGAVTHFWLIFQYHPNGSLHHYLKENQPLESTQVLELLQSAAAGILHLHTSVSSRGVLCKPPIAHRDIKTANILVKSSGCCCIADLGLALAAPKDGDLRSIHYKVGTKRYIAPEILDDSISLTDFTSFLQADVYSFALVIWETLSNSNKDEMGYRLPYDRVVARTPSFEDMRQTVCHQGIRLDVNLDSHMPPLVAGDLTRLMGECWSAAPSSRLTMMRVYKNLTRAVDRLKMGNPSR